MPYLISVILSIASSLFATKAGQIAISRVLVSASLAFWVSTTVIFLNVYNSCFSAGGACVSLMSTSNLASPVLDALALVPHETIDMVLSMISLRAAGVFYLTVIRVNLRTLLSRV